MVNLEYISTNALLLRDKHASLNLSCDRLAIVLNRADWLLVLEEGRHKYAFYVTQSPEALANSQHWFEVYGVRVMWSPGLPEGAMMKGDYDL